MKLLLLFVITVRPLGADTRDTESIYSLTIDRRIRCGTYARTAARERIRLPRTGRSTPNTRVRLLNVTQNLPVLLFREGTGLQTLFSSEGISSFGSL